MGAAGSTTRRAAGLPAAKRVDAGPGAGGRAGAAVGVGDARLNLAEELFDLALVLRKNSGRQAVFRSIGEGDGLVQRRHVRKERDGHEELFAEERVAGGEA